jgi:thioredoxin reductase (NADPH)
MIETLIYAGVALIAVGIPTVYIYSAYRKSRKSALILQKSIESGMGEPVSLHPVIDPNKCIGSGACVTACPEGEIIGLIRGRAHLIKPSRCIGHGECRSACPVGAITLVFGTETRGVEIPHILGTFETNVPGIYIAGELGGMGLIRNAVTQGREAVEYIAKSLEGKHRDDMHDLVIIGCGPAGIAASLQAKKENLDFVPIDQEDLGGTILSYPRAKLVMTQPVEFPLYGKLNLREIQKEELLGFFVKLFDDVGLKVRDGEKVTEIAKVDGAFKIISHKGEYLTQRVLLTIGRRGSPRKLGVPGEKSDKVFYRLLDPEKFHDLKILVVGGGDSAIEAVLALADQPGNTVHISYRQEVFSRIKEGNRARIDKAISANNVRTIFNSQITRIEPDKVALDQNGEEIILPNDYVFVFIGGELPTEFLKKIGIEFTEKRGES